MKSTPVTTAIIMAGGYGSRMMPVTAAVQKELLPLGNRPIIDYVVNDCVGAGITRIIFTVRPGSHGLQDYFLGNDELDDALRRLGKAKILAQLKAIRHQATFEFVEQPASAGYGSAIPIQVAAPHLPRGESVIVCSGDDVIWHRDGAPETAALLQTHQAAGGIGTLTALKKPSSELSQYGVLSLKHHNGHNYLKDFVEKPAPGTEPSNLINLSKYVVTPDLLPYIMEVTPDKKSGEYFITDAILNASRDRPIAVHQATGTYLDTGNPISWLQANLEVTGNHSGKNMI